MSIYGFNQVGEVIVAGSSSSEGTIGDFLSGAADGAVEAVAVDGSGVALNKKFRLVQKAAGALGGYEFSDVIDPKKIKKAVIKKYAAEVQKSVEVSGFATAAAANTTYAIEIRLFNDAANLSPENYEIITGYFTTGAAGASAAEIRAGLKDALLYNLKKRSFTDVESGLKEVSVTDDTGNDKLIITGIAQSVVPGKVIGRQIEFEVTPKVFDDTSIHVENVGGLTATVASQNHPGVGTGKYAVNMEWFTKGFKYDAYRQSGFPADFTEKTPFYASQSETYSVIHITYVNDRISPTVEEQPRTLTILCGGALDGVTVANLVAGNIEQFTGELFATLS